MSQSSIRQSPWWNPRSILQVWPEERPSCTGITQHGLRCKNTISQADLGRAAEILDTLAVRRLEKGICKESLENLAYVLLCKRWHRQPGHSQIPFVTRTWKSRLDTFYSYCDQVGAVRPRTQTRSVIQSSRSDEQSSIVPRHASASSYVSNLQTVARTTIRSGRQSEHNNPTGTRLIRVTVSSSEDQDSSGGSDASSDEEDSAASLDEADTITSSSLLDEEEQGIPSLQPVRSLASPPTALGTDVAETTRPRPQRKLLIEPCCVCMETLESETDAVWCRAQCGQNIHRGCFNEWRSQCFATYDDHPDHRNEVLDVRVHERSRMKSVTCVFCRTAWKWEWED